MKGEEGKENLLEIGSPQAHVRSVAMEIAGLEAVSFSTLCTCADPAKLRGVPGVPLLHFEEL